MNSVEICIWGPRNGFQIIYTENDKYKDYLNQTAKEIDGFLQNITQILHKDFYFLRKFDGKQVFTYVTDQNFDVTGRQTYMAISLIAPANQSFNEVLPTVLRTLWEIYAKANIKADGHKETNQFDASELRQCLATLSSSRSNYAYELSNRLIEFSPEEEATEFAQLFGQAKGDQAFFIRTPIPTGALSRLPSTRLSIAQLKQHVSAEEKEISTLKQYISNRQNFSEAQSLYTKWSSKLEQHVQSQFANWKADQEPKKNSLLELIYKGKAVTENEKHLIREAISTKNSEYIALTKAQQDELAKLITEEKKPEGPLDDPKKVIKEKISEAKKLGWTTDPYPIEEKLSKQKTLGASLDSQDVDNLRAWREGYNQHEYNTCRQLLANAYQKINKANAGERRANVTDFIGQVDTLRNRVISLADTAMKQELESMGEYQFLIAKKWVPVNRKPLLIKALISIAAISVCAVVFMVIQNKKKSEEAEAKYAKLDYDKDGVINEVDAEDSTRWIGSKKYGLKDYVDRYGVIDISKTSKLCDCWEFPKKSDREILKCTDNKTWFVFNTTLYEFRDGDFWSSDSNRISSAEDDDIETFYKEHFNVDAQTETTENHVDPDKIVELSYKGKTYRIKQGFLSNEGMTWTNAKWRYINNTWEKAPNPDNPRFSSNGVTNKDIEFFLSRNATVVPRNTQNNTNTGTNNGSSSTSGNSNTQTNTGNSNAGNSTSDQLTQDDNFWIGINIQLTTTGDISSDNRTKAKDNEFKKKDLTSKGKLAREKVIKFIND
jgi:hypothetical protein